MQVNFVGKERKEPVSFINEAGKYRFKIIKHEIDGYTAEGNEKNKYTFEAQKIVVVDGKPSLSKETYSMSALYNVDTKQEWVFMNLADALKIDCAFEPYQLVGYFFIADVEMKKGIKDDTKLYASINPYSYKYSVANDSLPKITPPKNDVSFDVDADASILAEAEELF